MKPIPINGIRLGPGLVWTGQDSSESRPLFPMCQALATRRINQICVGLHRRGPGESFSGCVESRYRQILVRLADDDPTVPRPAPVTLVSVYPHRQRFEVPLVLMKMLAASGIPFYHLVSSPAVLSVVIDTKNQEQVVALLETTFDLPPSHTPYIPEIDQDISALLKKYPETRSTYVEEKIKTYGIQLTPKVYLYRVQDDRDRRMQIQERLAGAMTSDAGFYLISVLRMASGCLDAVLVIGPDSFSGQGGKEAEPVDLITFHGPHFGDRYRILQTALDSLDSRQVPLQVAACAGASISLVFPAGAGAAAKTALEKGFEAP